MPIYMCPNCDKRLTTANAVPAGKSITCPGCKTPFVPAPVATAAPVAPAAAAPIAFKPEAPPPPPPPPARDDDEDANPYGVIKESEEEQKLADANKPKFGELKDKFVKSKRGPAMALLVLPANLMIAEGALTTFIGLFLMLIGFWPLVFTDSTPSSEELVDNLYVAFIGGFAALWGAVICMGAAKMQNLGSYTWAVAGACIAILPLLAGVFALVALNDPRVKEGFAEPESGPIQSEKKEDDKKKDEDEDDDENEEDEDDEDEDDRPKKRKKR